MKAEQFNAVMLEMRSIIEQPFSKDDITNVDKKILWDILYKIHDIIEENIDIIQEEI